MPSMQENNFSKERVGDLLQSTEAWERERPGKINALKLMLLYIYIYIYIDGFWLSRDYL